LFGRTISRMPCAFPAITNMAMAWPSSPAMATQRANLPAA